MTSLPLLGCTPEPPKSLARGPRTAWTVAQVAVFCAGAGIVLALIVWPRVGLAALWSVLVAAAPALLVFAPGLWRNVCPLGSAALFSRHMGWSARRRLSPAAQGWFALGALLLLLLIVPLRHVVLDTNGPVTGATLIGVGALSIALGLVFEWKSGWCSGLCPVHPVEKLLGARPSVTPPNAHCTACQRCTSPCADSTPEMHPLRSPPTPGHTIAGRVLVGGFPGFVWGWYQVSDKVGTDPRGIAEAYALPMAGLGVTLAIYLLVRRLVAARHADLLVRIFAAAAVSCYYWFRLPMLFGFGPFPGEGMLMDLSGTLPPWSPALMQGATTILFVWWLVWRPARQRAWTVRPPFAPVAAPR